MVRTARAAGVNQLGRKRPLNRASPYKAGRKR